ncbi:hypothetical protein E2C01_072671 [Portunus trituberculatus]|uniref:Uncharacterized protein n=1 Tax=Portunus trituberculatus TaxID=210409 RepID=A0A5B7I8H1_PORTR|nr:hypothetical protein [Portunus trituberculatus]
MLRPPCLPSRHLHDPSFHVQLLSQRLGYTMGSAALPTPSPLPTSQVPYCRPLDHCASARLPSTSTSAAVAAAAITDNAAASLIILFHKV